MECINEIIFRKALIESLKPYKGYFKGVCGPGRSGALAAVYASHILGVPFVPFKQHIPEDLFPLLIVDTTQKSGRTMRKAVEWYKKLQLGEVQGLTPYSANAKLHFWFESNFLFTQED